MNYRAHIGSNFKLAYPIMLSMLGQVMTGVADSVMVGWTGAVPLAAASFANTFFNVLLYFCIGVSYAITPLVAQAHGADNPLKVNAVLRHGLIINMTVGLFVMVIIYLMRPLMDYMGQPDEVVMLGVPYLQIITASILPTMVYQTFRQFCEGLQHTRLAMVVIIFSNLINILLNYLLIFGVAGFPELGLAGAGWATFIARCVMAIAMAVYVLSSNSFKLFQPTYLFGKYKKELFLKLLHLGIPAGSQFIFEAGAFGFSAIMMGWIGTIPLAAHQIALNLATISYMTTSGLGAAATIKVGNYLGQGDKLNLRKSAFAMFAMAAIIMTCWALIFIVFRNYLPQLYIDDTAVIEAASVLLVIAAFFQLSDGVQVVCAGALRGLQDVKIPSILIFIAYWIISLPIGYLLAFPVGLGATGIWIGLLTGLTLTAIAMLIRFNHLSNRTRFID